ncbi:bifunctional phosphopantothenoylcysteine decarboxylase/phosphopantothenate--cysteine ligase CoaBC [Desulfurispirillum indicum]|uniref:bifunctional phosphopantothenoylcysteine decarboxylase/phosphopantothenate--cysteine ligase CoaBC n=1 Tax=Desulfurispirillum indicum TaxID=936456 RepID=UPI001CFBB6E2|nr:bifunctional phosphopantothenoylcysteine decarboxylase/phosphopantothenate--cysteine ligase CoaBC [Desulfurispirillum indicum]UCZ56455.1 bifunctional phosphopantothenoylcysteine decarboxylase/phosphopantothenate--cysteine ligase CoaBC [Desulfurispirillum indicum]
MNVLLGICGSIAAYKACDLLRLFVKDGHSVKVCMTTNARHFVTPLTLESLSGSPVYTDEFALGVRTNAEHIELTKWCDLFVIAPASASVLGKMAAAIADNPVNTLYLACRKPVLVAPAMNTAMLEHPATGRAMDLLRTDGVHFVEPWCGSLACGDIGRGKLAPIEDIYAHSLHLLEPRKDFAGKRVLVSAGPTREPLDPVRYLSNHSSGKMGYALAQALYQRGAEVTLVSGPVSLSVPYGVRCIPVETATQMHAAIMEQRHHADVIIKAAAVADFAPAEPGSIKWKKTREDDVPTLSLTRNPDILHTLCQSRQPGQYIVGFAAETHDLERHAREKLQRKGADMLIANLVGADHGGFGRDENTVEIFTPTGSHGQFSGSKIQVAHAILDQVAMQCTVP